MGFRFVKAIVKYFCGYLAALSVFFKMKERGLKGGKSDNDYLFFGQFDNTGEAMLLGFFGFNGYAMGVTPMGKEQIGWPIEAINFANTGTSG